MTEGAPGIEEPKWQGRLARIALATFLIGETAWVVSFWKGPFSDSYLVRVIEGRAPSIIITVGLLLAVAVLVARGLSNVATSDRLSALIVVILIVLSMLASRFVPEIGRGFTSVLAPLSLMSFTAPASARSLPARILLLVVAAVLAFLVMGIALPKPNPSDFFDAWNYLALLALAPLQVALVVFGMIRSLLLAPRPAESV